jgi:hypothetical protein
MLGLPALHSRVLVTDIPGFLRTGRGPFGGASYFCCACDHVTVDQSGLTTFAFANVRSIMMAYVGLFPSHL